MSQNFQLGAIAPGEGEASMAGYIQHLFVKLHNRAANHISRKLKRSKTNGRPASELAIRGIINQLFTRNFITLNPLRLAGRVLYLCCNENFNPLVFHPVRAPGDDPRPGGVGRRLPAGPAH